MRIAAIAVPLAVHCLACGPGVPDVPPGQAVSYSKHLEPLVLERCLSCHTAEKPEADLVLERGRGHAELVGRSSVQVEGKRLVVPGDLESSYLWDKLIHRAEKGEGMPRTLFGAKRLPPEELERFRRWIEDGAQP
jgi:hypothetical protein